MTTRNPKISVVVPVFNEAENLNDFYNRTYQVLERLKDQYDHEFVFTDNHSSDATFELLKKLSQLNPQVKVCRFSKNFGYQNSILTGYSLCTGDAAIQLDCDLQDPPELLPQFLDLWRAGYKVVYGIRRSRKENFILTKIREVFYNVVNKLSDDFLPPNAGDFRLVDRRVIDELVQNYDANPYLRGSLASIGFKQTGIEYDRDPRTRGQSKFSLLGLSKLAFDGIFGSSLVPLRLATCFGGVVLIFTLLGATGYFVARILYGSNWPAGFATLALLNLTTLAINLIFLGILGSYIGRIFQQVRKRPNTIIEESINLQVDQKRVPELRS